MSHRAKQAMTEGQFDEASALYAKLVRAVPDNPGFRLDLGLALHSAGRYGEAVAQFEVFLKHQPDSTPAWLPLGLDYMKLERASEAVRPLGGSLRPSPRISLPVWNWHRLYCPSTALTRLWHSWKA
jgi:predicted Zn-dependent protease